MANLKDYAGKRAENLAVRHQRNRREGLTMEIRNQRGVCPLQILDRVKKEFEKEGRQLSYREMADRGHAGLMKSAQIVYGSWNNVIEKLGYQPKKSGGQLVWTKESLIETVKDFIKIHKRPPTHSDQLRRLIPRYEAFRRRGITFNEAIQLAIK